MTVHRVGRAGAKLAVAVAGATALLMLVTSPATASPIFCGAAWGRTADIALQGAIDDATYSARTMGYYGPCTLADEPQISEAFDDPYSGHVFYASVNLNCEQ